MLEPQPMTVRYFFTSMYNDSASPRKANFVQLYTDRP